MLKQILKTIRAYRQGYLDFVALYHFDTPFGGCAPSHRQVALFNKNSKKWSHKPEIWLWRRGFFAAERQTATHLERNEL